MFPETPFCDWCGSQTVDLGPQYGSIRLALCPTCSHEMQYVPEVSFHKEVIL